MDIMWTNDAWHGGAHIIEIECAYIPHEWVLKNLDGECNHEDSLMEWNVYKWVPPQTNVKMPRI